MRTYDPKLDAWMQKMAGLGYDRQWVHHNYEALLKRYRDTQGAPMPPCPEPPRREYDPYREL